MTKVIPVALLAYTNNRRSPAISDQAVVLDAKIVRMKPSVNLSLIAGQQRLVEYATDLVEQRK